MAGNSSDEDGDSPTHPAERAMPCPERGSPVPDGVEPSAPVVLLSSQEDPEDDDSKDAMKAADPIDEGAGGDDDMGCTEKVTEEPQEHSSGSNGDSTVPPPFHAVVEKKHMFEDGTDQDTGAKIKSLQKMLADAKKLQTAKSLCSSTWFLYFGFLISTMHFLWFFPPNSQNLNFWHCFFLVFSLAKVLNMCKTEESTEESSQFCG